MGPWLALALLALFRVFLDKDAGLPSVDSDYGVHLALAFKMRELDVFPPPYRGMLLSHTLAALLSLLMDGPKAWLLLRDFSVLGTAAGIGYSAPVLGRPGRGFIASSLFFVLGLFYAGSMTEKGFLPQLVAWPFYAWALAFAIADRIHAKARPLRTTLFFALGILCYPDQAIWVGPALAVLARNRFALLAALSVSLVLLFSQARLTHLHGQVSFPGASWIQIVISVSFLLAAVWNARELGHFWLALAAAYVVAVVAVAATSYVVNSQVEFPLPRISYYARKNLYAFAMIAPFLILGIAEARWARWMALFAGLPVALNFTLLLPVSWRQIPSLYVLPRSSDFSAEDETCADELKRRARAESCDRYFVLPGSARRGADREAHAGAIIRSYAYNALSGVIKGDMTVRDLPLGAWRFGELQSELEARFGSLSPTERLAEIERVFDPARAYRCFFYPLAWGKEKTPSVAACDGNRSPFLLNVRR